MMRCIYWNVLTVALFHVQKLVSTSHPFLVANKNIEGHEILGTILRLFFLPRKLKNKGIEHEVNKTNKFIDYRNNE